jgi:hypothetical protein
MSSPRVNSLVILGTNTQIVSGRHPRVSPMLPLRWGGSLLVLSAGQTSVSPAVMSGQAIVTDTPMSVVTRHIFSPIHPSLCKLSWPPPSNTLSAYQGGRSDEILISLSTLFVFSVLVNPFLGSVSGYIPIIGTSFEYGWRPHTNSRWLVPSCYTWLLVNVVLWAHQPHVHGLLVHSSRLRHPFCRVGHLPIHRDNLFKDGGCSCSAST